MKFDNYQEKPYQLNFLKSHLIIMAVVSMLIISSCQKNKIITLSGKIENPNAISLLINDDFNHTPDTIAVKNGEFSTIITLDNPGFRYLIFDTIIKEIFLAPGYALKLSFNANIDNRFKLEGKGAAENNIHDSISKAISKLNYSRIYTPAPEVGIKYIDSLFNNYQKYFDKLISSTPLDPVFIEFEKASLTYSAAGFKTQLGLQKNIKDPAYYLFLKDIDLENDKHLDILNYRDLLSCYLNVQTNNVSEKKDPSDEEYLDAFLLSTQKIKNQKIREYFIFDKISLFIEHDLVKDPAKYQEYFTKHNTDSIYAKKMQISYAIHAKKTLLASGKYAPEFTLADIDNNSVSLKDFKGKYVYIDFWATWCAPCVEELPYYVKLQSAYKDKNIVFISISLDSDKNKWLKFLKERESKKGDLHAEKGMDSEVAKAYQIKSVPVFVLIDKEGKIIDHHAPVPSSSEIRKTLDSLSMLNISSN